MEEKLDALGTCLRGSVPNRVGGTSVRGRISSPSLPPSVSIFSHIKQNQSDKFVLEVQEMLWQFLFYGMCEL